MSGLQKLGAGIAVLSIASGLCGIVWSLYPAFVATTDSDYSALRGSPGDSMIWFAILTVAGGLMGTGLIVVSRRRDKKARPITGE